MYKYHFYSLAVEAGVYSDVGRVVDLCLKLSNVQSRLVPGWVTRDGLMPVHVKLFLIIKKLLAY